MERVRRMRDVKGVGWVSICPKEEGEQQR